MFEFIDVGKDNSHLYIVSHENGVLCGDLVCGEDGFYSWWPRDSFRGGCWSAESLLEIGNKLKELNAPMEKELEEFFKGKNV